MTDFLQVVRRRKSVRSFSAEPVPRSVIEDIVAIALEAPTNCNQQLWNFIIVDDPLVKEQLVSEAAGNTLFRRAPVLIAVTYDGWNYKEAIQGASLAVGHLLLAATYYGISASPVNSYGADAKVKAVLGIPEHETICCFVTIGYPDARAKKAPPVPRKRLTEVIHWNAFSSKFRLPFTYDPNDWSLAELREHQRHYCRKTFLGKEMDLAGSFEHRLVKETLRTATAPFLDVVSYDGSYLRDLPAGDLETLDLSPETAAYTSEAALLTSRSVKANHVYEENAHRLPGNPRTITLLYKAERLSENILTRLFTQAYATLPKDGILVIVSRRRPSFFSIFYSLLTVVFGQDVRKTGIYAFFGPYRPVRVRRILNIARRSGFSKLIWKGYLPFPGFFEQLYQMVVQYIRSAGSSYLHRDRRVDIISKSVDAALKVQGLVSAGVLGSVAVIICRK